MKRRPGPAGPLPRTLLTNLNMIMDYTWTDRLFQSVENIVMWRSRRRSMVLLLTSDAHYTVGWLTPANILAVSQCLAVSQTALYMGKEVVIIWLSNNMAFT